MNAQEKEIQEIIKKHLPAQAGEVLQTTLEQAKKDAANLNSFRKDINDRNETIIELKKVVAEYKKNDERDTKLTERELVVKETQRQLELEILKNKLACEESKVNFTKEVLLGLVRNTNYRKSIFDSENQAPYYNGNQYVQPSPINKSFTETKTEE